MDRASPVKIALVKILLKRLPKNQGLAYPFDFHQGMCYSISVPTELCFRSPRIGAVARIN
jgi:hypothetical protein